jgi:hypothetical protein
MTWLLIALLGLVISSVCNQLDRFFLGRTFSGKRMGFLYFRLENPECVPKF